MSFNFIQKINEIAPNNISSPSRNVLLLGKRLVGTNNGRVYLSQPMYDRPNYLEPIFLPSFSDGKSALDYMKKLGFRVKFGQTNTLQMTAPSKVETNGTIITLTWNVVPSKFSLLVSAQSKGTATQGSINGNILGIGYNQINGQTVGQILLSTAGVFNTTDPVNVVSFLNLIFPDPNETDPIACMCFWFYQTAILQPQNIDGSPSAVLSVLPQNATSASYVDAVAMANPDSVVGNDLLFNYTNIQTDPINGNQYIDIQGAGLLPLTYLNDFCKVIQDQTVPTLSNDQLDKNNTKLKNKSDIGATLVSAIYNGYSIDTIAKKLIIHTLGTTGEAFNTTKAISISVSDVPQNVFGYLKNIDIRAVVPQYEIKSANYVTQTHVDIFDGIAGLNNGEQALENHFLTFAVCGNISTLPPQMTNLALNFNNYSYIFPQYPYVPSFGDIQLNGAEENTKVGASCVASQVAYCIANQDLTSTNNEKSSIMGINLNLPVCSQANIPNFSYNNKFSNIAAEQGLLTLSPNNIGGVVIDKSVTNQIYLPNTNVRNMEFQQIFVWLTVYEIKKIVAETVEVVIIKSDNSGTKVISDLLLSQLQTAIISKFQILENVGLLMNVNLYASQITVTRDINNPTIILIDAPAQIVPSLTAVEATINLYSASYNFNTQGA
jgi:hypothetical protein